MAAAPGTVALAESLTVRGNTVLVDHGWGVYSVYMHLSSIGVAVGSAVGAGQPIGAVGASGMVTGPHLHWEVRVHGIPVDPLPWLEPGPPQPP
jgi:murein DD-endopeptidase MepM/ murein hydrolase activator NlpD